MSTFPTRILLATDGELVRSIGKEAESNLRHASRFVRSD